MTSTPKNDDMRIVALTRRIQLTFGSSQVDTSVAYGAALGLASLVVRERNEKAIEAVESIGVEWVDLWPGVGG